MYVTMDGRRVEYVSYGGGEDVLLLHGWGCSHHTYDFIIKSLSDRFKVTAVDFPGFGGSDMLDEPWALKDYAEFTLKIIEALSLNNPVLIGHSHGGRVILYLCGHGLLSPEKIILMGAAGIRTKPRLKSRIRQRTFKAVKWLLTRKLWKNAAGSLLNKARAHFGSADYNAAPPVLRQTLVNVINEDLTPILPNIKASSLLIYGENDTATPVEQARIIEGGIPDAGLCIIKGAGHFCFAEKPFEVQRIIDCFLNRKQN